MTPDPLSRLTRRQFLWLGAVGSAGVLAARLTGARAWAAEVGPHGLYVLDSPGWSTLRAVAEVLLPPAAAAEPAALDDTARGVDRFLRSAPLADRRGMRRLLAAVEHAPVLLGPFDPPCSHMPRDERAAYLEGWAGSRLAVRRVGYDTLKRLVMLGYYSRDASWAAIGYGGPWL